MKPRYLFSIVLIMLICVPCHGLGFLQIATTPLRPFEPDCPVPFDTSKYTVPSNSIIPKHKESNVYEPVALPDASGNYVMTMKVLDSSALDAETSVMYYDGLGRPYQSVVGGMNTKGNYLHSLDEYDALGNVTQSWNPVIGDGSLNPMSDQDVIAASLSYCEGDRYGYTAKTYDLQGRTTSITRPGKAWRGRSNTITYATNDANAVKKYVLLSDKPVQQGFYPQGSLSRETTVDEDGVLVERYTDLLGNIILERRGNDICTYYVYDAIGQLRYVLSPRYQEKPDLKLFAYQYTYDHRGRVKTKTLPGCEYIEFWYDQADRVVKMQDALLRAVGKYRLYKYDSFGRITEQRLVGDDPWDEYIGTKEIANYYDSYTYENDYCHVNASYFSKRGEGSSEPCKIIDLILNNHGSTKGLLTETVQRASNGEELLTIYVYDDMARVVRQAEFGLGGRLFVTEYFYNFYDAVIIEKTSEYSLVDKTYSNVYASDIHDDLKPDNVMYYMIVDTLVSDASSYLKTKVVKTVNNYDIPHTKLLSSSVITIEDLVNGVTREDTIMKPIYDEFGRKVFDDRSGDIADMTYAYDKLHGKLKSINGGRQGNDMFVQNLYYESGSTNPCYNGSISAMEWKCGKYIMHRYDYTYDELNRLDYAHYSSYRASRSMDGSQTMELIPGYSSMGNYSVSYWYDKNSNLLEAERQGWAYVDANGEDVYDTVDDVMVEYKGNQRKSATWCSVTDENYYGKMTFVDGANNSEEYAYDGNGNLTRDDNKGITQIEYDLLGHPKKVTFKGNRFIEYVYAADGRKLKTIHCTVIRGRTYPPSRPGATRPKTEYLYIGDTTEYINNYVFENGKPKMYCFKGGYYSFDKEGLLDGCHFYIQDYQGNNRMVVNAETDKVEQISHYYPYGALMGDISTQPEVQDFKYSGKEIDRKFGLDLYDFHARQYDPLVSGFNSIDDHAEKYYWLSPYNYCAGNPVNCVDKDGKDGVRIIDNENKIITVKATYFVKTAATPYRKGKGKVVKELAGYSQSDIAKMNKYGKSLNKQNLIVTEGEYKGYKINFDLEFKDGKDLSVGSCVAVYEGNDISNTIQPGNEYTHKNVGFKEAYNGDGTTSVVGGVTQQSKNIVMNKGVSNADTKKNRLHEIFHTLGLTHPMRVGASSGIMAYPPQNPNNDDANNLINNIILKNIIKK